MRQRLVEGQAQGQPVGVAARQAPQAILQPRLAAAEDDPLEFGAGQKIGFEQRADQIDALLIGQARIVARAGARSRWQPQLAL